MLMNTCKHTSFVVSYRRRGRLIATMFSGEIIFSHPAGF